MIAITPDKAKNPKKIKDFILKTGKFPDLFSKTTLGNIKKTAIWRVEVKEMDDRSAIVYIYHGYIENLPVNNDTLTAEKPKVYKTGKNIDKINETTPYQQAMNETVSLYLDKYKRSDPDINYSDSNLLIFPMLALKYQEYKHNVSWPAYIQPKLDGVRCLATLATDGKVTMYTRSMKEIGGLNGYKAEIASFLREMSYNSRRTIFLDGEICKTVGSPMALQKIAGIVNRKDASELESIEGMKYNLFDILYSDKLDTPFDERFGALQDSLSKTKLAYRFLMIVPIAVVKNEEDIANWHRNYMMLGYEGSIIRNTKSYYKLAHGRTAGRSQDLLKLKTQNDDWVKITAITENDKTKSKFGIVVTVFDDIYGISYNINGSGIEEYRRRVLKNKDEYIDQYIRINYLDRTDDHVPRIASLPLFEGKYQVAKNKPI